MVQADQPKLMKLLRSIADNDRSAGVGLLAASPMLATARLEVGATRQGSDVYFLEAIGHVLYAGETALHTSAAAYRSDIARRLIKMGADVRAKNRRGAEPLHYAAVGGPGADTWDPRSQVATIACLIDAGADPNAVDKSGVTPLHRAVRARCAAAVAALLDRGADPHRRNGNGSTPTLLAGINTGRGGTGSPAAKLQQEKIVRLLAAALKG